MLKVGVTGGIGSGKTAACQIFEALGIPVYYADDRAKWLMNNHPGLKEELIHQFSSDIWTNQGLNKVLLAEIVFNDQAQLNKLNNLVHPKVFEDFENWCEQHETFSYIIKEAALLVESGSYKNLDELIVVDAPERLRINRVRQRDKISEEEVRLRLEKQMPQEEKLQFAQHVIINDGKQSLLHQVLTLHKYFIKKEK